MALVEEDLPKFSKVRGEFQVREDQVLAHRLQEEEFEEHFNCNVQSRRTARYDVSVAQQIQDSENQSFHREESLRLQSLKEREDSDREHAEAIARDLENEERTIHERELSDQKHAALMDQKLKEEEDIREALQMQDEIMVRKMQKSEANRMAQRRAQEEDDGRLALQHQTDRLSGRELQKMKQLQLKSKGRPGLDPQSSPPPRTSELHGPNPVSSLPTNMGNMSLNAASCVTTPPSSAADGLLELPSYSQCVPDSYGPDEGDGGIIDENERISLQEAEDERLARAMMQQDDEESRRREQADLEFAHLMQEEEEKSRKASGSGTAHSHNQDLDLTRRLHQEEMEMRKKRQQQQQQLRDPDTELAMRLQKEEVMKQRELKKQKEAQLRAMADARERYPQTAPQQKSHSKPQRIGSSIMHNPAPLLVEQKKGKSSSAFIGYEVPPLHDDSQSSVSRTMPNVRLERGSGQQQQQRTMATSPSSPPSQQQSVLPDGHPFNSALTSNYSYQPAMAGIQVPYVPKIPTSSHAKPSYKRAPVKKK